MMPINVGIGYSLFQAVLQAPPVSCVKGISFKLENYKKHFQNNTNTSTKKPTRSLIY